MLYDVLKAAHIVAVIVWFGGTLVAALVLAFGAGEALRKFHEFDRRITTPAMALVWALGLTMAVWFGWFASAWLIAKLVFVVVLSGIHGMVSGRLRRAAAAGGELPALDLRLILPAMLACLCAIALLVVLKPF